MKTFLSRFFAVLTIFSMVTNVAFASNPNNDNNENNDGDQVTICHHTESENNPYVVLTVDVNGLNGHGDHDGDIIPITDQNGDNEITTADCLLASNQDGDDGCESEDHTATTSENDDCGNDDDGDDCQQNVSDINEGEGNEGDDCGNNCDTQDLVAIDTQDNGGCDDGNDDGCPTEDRIAIDTQDDGNDCGGVNTGSITVCKIVVNNENEIVNGADASGALFTIPWLIKLETLDESWTEAGVPAPTQFTTPLNLNSNVVQIYKGSDSECTTYAQLPLGGYFYGQEQITGGSGTVAWATPKYNDQNTQNVTDVSDFFPYDSSLYDDGDPDNNRNTNADGHIILTPESPNRTLVVLNQYSPVCVPVRGLPVYARIKFSKISDGAAMNGWRNWGASADMAPQVFVGGNNPLPHGSGGNVYNDEEWFMIYDGLNYINDADISGYEDVPGIAVERMNGKIRVVLDGHHTLLNTEFGAKELAAGVVQFSNDAITISADAVPVSFKSPMNWGPGNVNDGWSNDSMNPRIHDAVVNDAANPMDARGAFIGYIDQYNERFDRARTNGNKVEFQLVATTGSDGFYVQYNHTPGTPCDPVEVCTPVLGLPVYARIKFSTDPNANFGVRNWGTGNLAKNIYVGGNTPADAYADGQWFMIYDGMNYVNDLDIAGYEDVPGLAVQRLNGQIRVVLHGSWTEPVGNDQANKERAQFTIQFSQDGSTVSPNVTPTSYTSDAANPLDFTAGKNTNDPQDDRVAIVGNSIQVKMVATTNDDGFYADYTHTAHGIPCIGEQNPQ
jgi:hypothetical protein